MLGLAILVAACNKNDSEKRDAPVIVKKNTSLVSPRMNSEVTLGESLDFVFNSKEAAIDSVVLTVNGETESFSTSSFTWTPETNRTGKFSFKATVYCGEQNESHYPRLIMLSDIEPELFTYQIVNKYPHSTDAYTQGLFFLGDELIESTGQKGESVIRKVDLETGQSIKVTPIGDQYFGEGSTFYNDEIYLVTWTSLTGFVFDTDLNLKRSFPFQFQGWGLTTMGDSLVLTQGMDAQGSEKVYFINPQGFTEIGHIEVYNHEGPIDNLNELELIDGLLYANEWQTNKVHVIEPSTGKVLQTIDFAGLLTPNEASNADVLNGIAYHKEDERLFVTGKNWPWLFEVELQPKN